MTKLINSLSDLYPDPMETSDIQVDEAEAEAEITTEEDVVNEDEEIQTIMIIAPQPQLGLQTEGETEAWIGDQALNL
uniref:Uncharacterized protein n=1 Tax=Kalanchoe fedtschenkoi TaxID=63787 RepID=A0A7N1A4K6_KALFE